MKRKTHSFQNTSIRFEFNLTNETKNCVCVLLFFVFFFLLSLSVVLHYAKRNKKNMLIYNENRVFTGNIENVSAKRSFQVIALHFSVFLCSRLYI